MPRSRARLSINVESTISALQQSDAAGVQAIAAHVSETHHFVRVERGVELTDPGTIGLSSGQGKHLRGPTGIDQQQQAPLRVAALSEPNPQGAQVCILPLTMLHLRAAGI